MFESEDGTGTAEAVTTATADDVEAAWGPPTAEERELIWELDQMARARLATQDLPDDGEDPQVFPGPEDGLWAGLRSPRPEVLAAEPTGSQLAFLVEEADPGAVDDYTVVEVFAAWWRLVNWAHAGAARAAAELAARQEALTGPPAAGPGDEPARAMRGLSAAATELAMRVMISRPAAQAMIDVGKATTGALWPITQGLAEGVLDLPRARAFVDALAHVPDPVAIEVQEEVLPTAPRRTTRQVRADIARALIATDPQEATARHRRARARRRVCRPAPLPDGMAGIWAVLSASDAVALDLTLDAAARTARSSGDARSSDQLRADALAGLAHHALHTGWIGTPPRQSGPPSGHDPAFGTVPHAQRRGAESGAQPGAAPPTEPGRQHDDVAPGASFHSGAGAPPVFRVGTIGGRPARIRVTVPLGVLVPPEDVGATHERGSPSGDADRGRPAGPVGAMAEVAELDGYGPITPDVARALALGGTWNRLITDPDTGALHQVGSRRYRPPADLADLVRARDKTCTRPGCAVPAQACDLDHTVPFHLGGSTAAWNLAPLCSTDHALKSAGALRIEHVAPGTYDVRTPSGHVYRRHPDGTTTRRKPDPGPDTPPY